MSLTLIEKIIDNIELAPDIYQMLICSEYIAKCAKPGQFVNIKCCEGTNAILRRPISICDVNREKNHVSLVYQKRGTGTEFLSKKRAGDTLDIIGPLGKGFDICDNNKSMAVIGGGIGIFPLLFLLKESSSLNKSAFIGFRNKDYAVLVDEYKKNVSNLFISTDDGSLGYKGVVTRLFQETLISEKYDIIYSCGPEKMMKRVAQLAIDAKIPCQLSLEQRMGCGIGACLACAVKIKTDETWQYKRVCKDGPVFLAEEVIFDE